MKSLAILLALLPIPALADMAQARSLMSAGRFEETVDELQPALRAGNADAAQMMGVIYSLGLVGEPDQARAFDYFLRAALLGQPAAQASVAYHFETGRGIAAPDPMRAYVWYALAAIGGDADAAESQASVLAGLNKDEIEKAHELIEDYRRWLFPFD
ncbi:tetratricopeptide repeat protein [Halovulum sp. GXIMD14793]